jgi:histone H3/H4
MIAALCATTMAACLRPKRSTIKRRDMYLATIAIETKVVGARNNYHT